MAIQKTKFNFIPKEGKYFAPIVGTTNIRNGIKAPEGVLYPKAGVKGVFAKVRLELPSDVANQKKELYAVSSEVFTSSR